MQATADVVIIGAGVIGCSTAYHLARMGITDVVIVEMDQVGSGSSSKSASMLSLQARHDELGIRMAQYCYARYMQFEEELGTPIDFRRIGWLSVAGEESAPSLLHQVKLLQSLGVRAEVLTVEEIRRRYPEINAEDLALGTWGPDDGIFDPHMIMWGFIKRATERGVRLYQGMRATGIRLRKGRVEGVEIDKGFISTRMVVNAGGPWAGEIGRWVGVEIPILNRARTVVVTGPLPEIPSDRPFLYDETAEWYCRPEGAGVLMGMGTVPVQEPTVQTDHEMVGKIVDVAVHRLPALERAKLLTAWTGIRPLTPDDLPVLGPVPSVEGFILNCGWGGTGIIHSPLAGQWIAELIHDGCASTLSIDIASLGIERFDHEQSMAHPAQQT